MASLPKLRPSLDPRHISEPVDTIELPTSAGPGIGCVSGWVAFKCGLMAVLEDNDQKMFIYNNERSDVLEFPVASYASQMAYDRHNNIIIALENRNTLLRFNVNGKTLPQLDVPPVYGSSGVACSPEGDIIVSSNDPPTIVKKATGESEWITLYRSQDDEYEEEIDDDEDNWFDPAWFTPGQISYGSDGELFVATKKCINVLDAGDGKVKRQIGCDKYREGEMSSVQVIFVTGDGYLFACDEEHYVHVFTTGGEHLSRFGGNVDEPGKFRPWRIMVDWKGYLLISDIGNGTIQVY